MVQNSAPPVTKITKKEIKKTLREKLTITLADYRSLVGEKKFDRRIRKAANLLGQDIAKALPKKQKNKTTV